VTDDPKSCSCTSARHGSDDKLTSRDVSATADVSLSWDSFEIFRHRSNETSLKLRFAVLLTVNRTVFRDDRSVVVRCVATGMSKITPIRASISLQRSVYLTSRLGKILTMYTLKIVMWNPYKFL